MRENSTHFPGERFSAIAMTGDAMPQGGRTLVRCGCGARLYRQHYAEHRKEECVLKADWNTPPPLDEPPEIVERVTMRTLAMSDPDRPELFALAVLRSPEHWPPADFCAQPITTYAGQALDRA